MFLKTAFDIDLESRMEAGKKDLEKTFKANFETQEQTLSIIIEAVNYSKHNNLVGNKLIWNTAGYINITGYDLKIIGRELFFSTNEWQKRYFSRQACLLIYELTNDIPSLLGKDFRSELNKLSDAHTLVMELNLITKAISDYKKDNHERLKNIRNVSVAHRDKDFFEQLSIIESIQWSEIIEYLVRFDNIMNDLGGFLQKVVQKSAVGLNK